MNRRDFMKIVVGAIVIPHLPISKDKVIMGVDKGCEEIMCIAEIHNGNEYARYQIMPDGRLFRI